MNPTPQQLNVYNWCKTSLMPDGTPRRHLGVIARAGCGKSTTAEHALPLVPEANKLYAAFNSAICEEMKPRLARSAPDVEAKTWHGVGFGFVRRYWPNVRVEGERGWRLAREVCGGDASPDEIVTNVQKLAARGKGSLALTVEQLMELALAVNLAPDEEWERDGWTLARVADCALKAMRAATRRDGTIDFDDQIFLPVVHKWAAPRWDFVVVDEAQDLNAAQHKLARMVCGGRLMMIGDPMQCIYEFRGADAAGMERGLTELEAGILPLTVTFRCGKRIVAACQALVPDYEAAPGNADGEIVGDIAASKVTVDNIGEHVMAGDFVLSRKNAPLASICLRLLRAGRKAKIEGRDIGKGLKATVSKLKAKSIPDFLKRVTAWEAKQSARAAASAKTEEAAEAKIAMVQDEAETLRALADGCSGVKELLTRIDELFTSGVGGEFVVLSSIHKAKGREAERVFVLADTLYPGKRTNQEEKNLHYVAMSRAKQTLVWVKGK